MPPLPVIAGVVRAAFNWETPEGGHAVNVMHFDVSGATVADLVTALSANVTPPMFNYGENNVVAHTVSITPLDGTTATSDHPISGWNGQRDPGDGSTPSLCALLKFTGATRGRSHRGRAFLPYVADVAHSYGHLASTVVTNMQAPWTTWLAAMLADNVPLVVASYKLATADLVDIVTVESACATQRRRQSRLR